MDRTDEQAMIHRNGRLAANIRAGQSPLTPELIETMSRQSAWPRDPLEGPGFQDRADQRWKV